ncbi:MAG: hypothetical protein ACRD4S_00965 [Candidatus Acidiferrales bacterium]
MAFEEIFLRDGARLQSTCGHEILIFDHHFFHLAAVTVTGIERLFMKEEKGRILSTSSGFGLYEVGEPRVKHLRSAYATFAAPDEVWQDNPRAHHAKWVYVKEFSSQPYPFSIALVTQRVDEGNIIVPVSSFPCKRTDVKKWRKGQKVYP